MEDSSSLLLVFGPQALSSSPDFLSELREIIKNRLSWDWVLDVFLELPSYLAKLHSESKAAVPADLNTASLVSWLRDGDRLEVEKLPNTIFTPLVVLTQLVQFWLYLPSELRESGDRNVFAAWRAQQDDEGVHCSTLGFCTGLLSAFTVASSRDQDEFQTFAAVALRLAMLIGACVDAREGEESRASSYGIVWKPSQKSTVNRIFEKFAPDVYTAVEFDEHRATITMPEHMADDVKDVLRDAGVLMADAGLRGQFHSSNPVAEQYSEAVARLCLDMDGLRFCNADESVMPTYSNINAPRANYFLAHGDLHLVAIRALLVEKCDWFKAFEAASGIRDSSRNGRIVSFSHSRCVPPSLITKLGSRLIQVTSLTQPSIPRLGPCPKGPIPPINEKGIAVVGISIKVAGAGDPESFAEMLKTGKSQHQVVGPDRLMPETMFRENAQPSQWYGNMISGVDEFDHKFFQRSSEEAAAMDPQQRLLLQAAYQTVEQSGHFTEVTRKGEDGEEDRRNVGVYVGACAVDYECHAACHKRTPFTYAGTQRASLAGNVSRHFGWTGPSITFDTACSASTVALHTACQDLVAGECSAALVAGVSVITNVLWFQNLAGASFLSPTGQCKPFDRDADGYCRAEGIACVFLKRMPNAIADGNHTLACILATAVNQNQNCTPLFVPNTPSLSHLFQDVIRKAELRPDDIQVAECHGTGTPVGDPAEYDSIRTALAGPKRFKPLSLGSVKGHVGHTEGASGLISLIKVIVMMQKGFIPPQASFKELSPRIQAKASDMMQVPTSLMPWNDVSKAALINNYGASGSNASVIVTMPPPPNFDELAKRLQTLLPFRISGLDAQSVQRVCNQFAEFIRSTETSLADLAYHINRKANSSLPHRVVLSCGSQAELLKKLDGYITSPPDSHIGQGKHADRPVILCFGGQRSMHLGLDHHLYQSVAILHHHLDTCDNEIRAQGLDSMYPDIFSQNPVLDPVRLQTMLFAAQYACAQSWIDCGVKVVAVTGHSFGELTALCVAGVLSLREAIRLIAGRARVIREKWPSDPGAMVAIEGEERLVDSLVDSANQAYSGDCPVNIACYNGPRSFTLAGSTRAIDRLLLLLSSDPRYVAMKHKRLEVSNAFHSGLVQPLMHELEKCGQGLEFRPAQIHVERATRLKSSSSSFSPRFVAEHMRMPVYFNQALHRLAEKWPAAVYLEAGFNSTITTMASKALTIKAFPGQNFFQGLNLTSADGGFATLTRTTAALWEQGVSTMFWPHHPLQTNQYECLFLPGYPFERSRHWLDLKRPSERFRQRLEEKQPAEDGKGLWTLIKSPDSDNKTYTYRINTAAEEYLRLVSGHIVAQTKAICPATLEIAMAIDALMSLHPEWKKGQLQPVTYDLVNHLAICTNAHREVQLELEPLNPDHTHWQWCFASIDRGTGGERQTHATAQIRMRGPSDGGFQAEFARLGRQAPYSRCLDVLNLEQTDQDGDSVHALHGRSVYRALGDVVNYGEVYRHVRTAVGQKDECAGRINRAHESPTWLDVPLSDAFSQVAGLGVNCMTDRGPNEMYLAHGCEMYMRNPSVTELAGQSGVWHVYVRNTRVSEKEYMSDLFVFDAADHTLVEMMIGIHYVRMAKASVSKMLRRLTGDTQPSSTVTSEPRESEEQCAVPPIRRNDEQADGKGASKGFATPQAESSPMEDVSEKLGALLAAIVDVEPRHMVDEAMLVDLGIDSLMAMEVAREIEVAFACKLEQTRMMQCVTFADLTSCVRDALGTSTAKSSCSIDEEDVEVRDHLPMSEVEVDVFDEMEAMVKEHVAGWKAPEVDPRPNRVSAADDISNSQYLGIGSVILVTGASGSLGSHLVASLAERADVAHVLCINRPSSQHADAHEHQKQAFAARGIDISANAIAKLRIVAVDLSAGLSADEYAWAVKNVTHIVHNAWPMSATRPLRAFASQCRALRHLLDLARDIVAASISHQPLTFQLVSSIGVVGHSKGPHGQRVPEQRVGRDAVLRNGYCQAKWVCERMLDETLHRCPQHFRAMVLRPGQIAGSTTSGFWNPHEHFAFIVKSAHTLRAWPDFAGQLQWIPVDIVAGTIVDLLAVHITSSPPHPHPVYHLDNAVGQPWNHMSPIMADALHIPPHRIIPFAEWLRLVREFGTAESNPAAQLVDWLEENFERMSCGGLILDTRHTQQHSRTLASAGPVTETQARRYIEAWRKTGFLPPY